MWTDEMRPMRCGILTQVTARPDLRSGRLCNASSGARRVELDNPRWYTLAHLGSPHFKHILKSFAMSISLSSVFNLCAQLMTEKAVESCY